MIDRLRFLLDRPLDPQAARAVVVFASAILLGFAALFVLGASESRRSAATGGGRSVSPRSQPARPLAVAPPVAAPAAPRTSRRRRQDPQDEQGSAAAKRAATACAPTAPCSTSPTGAAVSPSAWSGRRAPALCSPSAPRQSPLPAVAGRRSCAATATTGAPTSLAFRPEEDIVAERSLSCPPRAPAGRVPGATPLLVPTTLREANAFVARFHRHSGAVRGHKFSVGAALGDELVGVAIAGRPVARHRDDGLTIEVLRVCVAEGAPRNACSLLYGACWRAARAMGYRRAITYTLRTETGASVKASGFRVIGEVRRQSWDRPSRPRAERESRERLCWERAT